MRFGYLTLVGIAWLLGCSEAVASHLLDKAEKSSTAFTKKALQQKYRSHLFYHYDINGDGRSDYIISSNPRADGVDDERMTDLHLYLATTDGRYQLSTTATNFSEDGGNLVSDILPRLDGRGFITSTAFPDRGYYVKDYYIMPTERDNIWVIDKYIAKGYLNMVHEDGSFTEHFYYCSYPQPQHALFTQGNVNLEELVNFDDDHEKLEHCTTPVNYVVSANRAEILNDAFHHQKPANYYIKGDKIQAFEQNDDWIRVSYKGDRKFGWVSKSDLIPME